MKVSMHHSIAFEQQNTVDNSSSFMTVAYKDYVLLTDWLQETAMKPLAK